MNFKFMGLALAVVLVGTAACLAPSVGVAPRRSKRERSSRLGTRAGLCAVTEIRVWRGITGTLIPSECSS
jgi:hypothetical protein